MSKEQWETAREMVIEWKVNEFYRVNKRLPDPLEEEMIETGITEDEMRDAVSYIESAMYDDYEYGG